MIKSLIVSTVLAAFAASAMAAEPAQKVQISRDSRYIYIKTPARVVMDSEQEQSLRDSANLISAQLGQIAQQSATVDPNGDLRALADSARALNSRLDLLVSTASQLYGEVAPASNRLFMANPTGVIVFAGATADRNMFRFLQAGGSLVLGAVLVPTHVKRINIATKAVSEYTDWTSNSTLVILPTISGGVQISAESAAGAPTTDKKPRVGLGLIWGELNQASELVGLTGGASVTVDVGPGLNIKALGLKNWNKPGAVSNFIVLAGLQKSSGLQGRLPLIKVDAESSLNLGLILDAGAVFSSASKFTSNVAAKISGSKAGNADQ